MLTTLYSITGLALLAAVGVYALLRGGALERYAMGVATLGWLASLGVQSVSGIFDPVVGFLLIDTIAFAALVGLTWRSGRRWPLFAAGFQGLALSVDGMRVVSPHLSRWVYLTALAAAGYGLLAAIVFGTWEAGRLRVLAPAND